VKHRDVKFSPLTEIDPPKKPKSKVEFWDPEIIPDALKLFEGTKGEWYVKMALYTGLREGELCGLHEDFIDFKKEEFEIREQCQYIQGEGHIFLPPKTDESEEPLPLVSPIDELLRERILENKKIV
jgi:integrase